MYSLKNITEESKLKCKKCRSIVLETCNKTIVTGHSIQLMDIQDTNDTTDDTCGIDTTVWYIDSDTAPTWIIHRVSEGDWTKGRLNCPKCGARIGSFDFTTGAKCKCKQCLIPGMQIIKTKVDLQ